MNCWPVQGWMDQVMSTHSALHSCVLVHSNLFSICDCVSKAVWWYDNFIINWNIYLSSSSGMEHHIPLMADICPAVMGVSHLDHSICSVVLYGVFSRAGDLCRVTSSCAVHLWPSAYWWWITTPRPHRNIWLFWAGTEEMAIPLFTLGCTGKLYN